MSACVGENFFFPDRPSVRPLSLSSEEEEEGAAFSFPLPPFPPLFRRGLRLGGREGKGRKDLQGGPKEEENKAYASFLGQGQTGPPQSSAGP